MSDLLIESQLQGDTLLLRFKGEIGLTQEYKFRREALEAIDTAPNKVIVNILEITLLSSYGIAALVRLWKKQSERDGKICIICPQNHIYDCLSVAGTNKIIPIFTSEQQALEYFKDK